MKPLPTLILSLIVSVGMGQTRNIEFVSNKVFNSGGLYVEHHAIRIYYGQTDAACDTLMIDDQKYYVLFSGYSGEQVNGKTNWSIEFYGVKDPSTGRQANYKYMDIGLRCYVYIGREPEKKVQKIFIYNHGTSATYLKQRIK